MCFGHYNCLYATRPAILMRFKSKGIKSREVIILVEILIIKDKQASELFRLANCNTNRTRDPLSMRINSYTIFLINLTTILCLLTFRPRIEHTIIPLALFFGWTGGTNIRKAVKKGPIVEIKEYRVDRWHNTTVNRHFVVFYRYTGCNLVDLSY